MSRSAIALAAALSLTSGIAGAATVTFSNIDLSSPVQMEDGVTFDGNLFNFDPTPGRAHIDDRGSNALRTLTFRMAVPFVARGFDIFSLGTSYFPSGPDAPSELYDNVQVSLFLGDDAVFQKRFSSRKEGTVWRYLFPDGLGAVDALSIGARSTAPGCDSPCGHFEVDNVRLAPVPLPLPAALIGAGMAALVLVRRRRA